MKTLVISSGYFNGKRFNGTIDVVGWEKFSTEKEINFSDYDNLIIDLLSLSLLEKTSRLEESLEWFAEHYTTKQTYEILSGDNSSIVVLGDLNIKILGDTVLAYLGIEAETEQKKGTNFSERSYYQWRFCEYIDRIKRYSYTIRNIRAVGLEDYGIDGATVEQKLVARNKEDYIAASIKFGNWRSFDMALPMVEGNIELVPPIGDSQESIEAILEIIVGPVESNIIPLWANDICVKGQEELEKKIISNRKKISEIEGEISSISKNIDEVRSIVGVLYKANKPLELAVSSTFRSIGCIIEEPEEQNKEEFCIVFGDKKFVVEVKSSAKNTIDMKGFRQLADWQFEILDRKSELYKQLLIVNTEYDKPPNKRKPFVLADNQAICSEKKEICVITTKQLFDFVNDNRNNKTAVKKFISELSKTNGLFGA